MFNRKQYEKDMKRIRTRHRNHSKISECGKVAYETKTDAIYTASLRLRTSEEHMLRAYYHRDCGKWHLTSKELFTYDTHTIN